MVASEARGHGVSTSVAQGITHLENRTESTDWAGGRGRRTRSSRSAGARGAWVGGGRRCRDGGGGCRGRCVG